MEEETTVGKTTKELVENLVQAVHELGQRICTMDEVIRELLDIDGMVEHMEEGISTGGG